MRARRLLLAISLAWLALPAGSPLAAVPGIFAYQGKLSNASGQPLTNASGVGMRFRIFTGGGALLTTYVRDGSGGSSLVPVVNGAFDVLVGDLSAGTLSGTPVALALQSPGDLFLEVEAGGTTLTPRQRLVSAPYAMALADGSVGTAQLADGSVTFLKLAPGVLDWANLNPAGIPGGFVDGLDNGELSIRANGSFLVLTSTINYLPPLTVTSAGGTAAVGVDPSSVTLMGNAFNSTGLLLRLDAGVVPVSLGGLGVSTSSGARAALEAVSTGTRVLAGTGLSGGGALNADVSLSLDPAGFAGCDTSSSTGKLFWNGVRLTCGSDNGGTGGTVTGGGTANRLAKWTNGSGALGDSSVTDNGASVSVSAALNAPGGVTAPSFSGDGSGLLNVNAVTLDGTTSFARSTHTHAVGDFTSGVLGTARGGTGLTSYGAGNYLSALNAATLQDRTPAQVLLDVGATPASHGHDLASADVTGVLGAGNGGTGQTSLTADAFLLGNGTFPVTGLALGDGQLISGRTGQGPQAKTLQGTANRVLITTNAATITLAAPQDLAATSDVNFTFLTSSNALTAGTITSSSTLTTLTSAVIGDGAGSDVMSFDGTSGFLNLPATSSTQFTTDGQLRVASGISLEFLHLGTGRRLQNGVTGSCPGQVLATIFSNGAVFCDTDDQGAPAAQAKESDAAVVAAVTSWDFDGNDFNVSQSPLLEANIDLGIVGVSKGGIGVSSPAANGVLLGNGTNPVNVSTAMTELQLLVGRTGQAPVAKLLQGTTNQVVVSTSGSFINIGTAQFLSTSSFVTFGNVTVNGTMSFGSSGGLDLSSGVTTAGQLGLSGGNLVYRDSTAVRAVATTNRQIFGGDGMFGGGSISLAFDRSFDLDGSFGLKSCTDPVTSKLLWDGSLLECGFDGVSTGINIQGTPAGFMSGSTLDFSPRFSVTQSPAGEANVSLAAGAITGALIDDFSVNLDDIDTNSVQAAAGGGGGPLRCGTFPANPSDAIVAVNADGSLVCASDAGEIDPFSASGFGGGFLLRGAGGALLVSNNLTYTQVFPATSTAETFMLDASGTTTGGLVMQQGASTLRLSINGAADEVVLTSPYPFGTTNDRLGIGRKPVSQALEVEGTASKTAGTLWDAASDRRVKMDVQDLSSPLAVVEKLRPVAFRYRPEYRAKHPSLLDHDYFGFIAQEYREVFPDYVTDSGEDGILLLDSSSVIPYTVAAVQELDREYEELKAERDALLRRVEALESGR